MGDIEVAIKSFINNLCNIKLSNNQFPGGLPVSIDRDIIPRLFGDDETCYREYVLSYKADGINGGRYFLGFLCLEGDFLSFLIDRNFKITFLQAKAYDIAYEGTVFDIEFLKTKDGNILFLIFDTLCIHGNSVIEQFYPTRLEIAREFLARLPKEANRVEFPHSELAYKSNRKDIMVDFAKENDDTIIRIKVKKIYYVQAIEFLQGASLYDTDGFIWTAAASSYSIFRSQSNTIYKWKPLGQITIDFMLINPSHSSNFASLQKIEGIPEKYRKRLGNCLLFTQNNNRDIFISRIESSHLGGIYECYWDGDRWEIIKERTDKAKPNHLSTVVKTIQNIEQNITVSEIISYFKK